MEPCKDADEFIKTYGADAFQKRIDDAENSFLYEVRILERNYDLNDPAGKTSFSMKFLLNLHHLKKK